MRTIRTKVYKFDELSEQAKQTAIEKLSDINVGYDWWESTYEDAANVGLKITSFDLDRNRYAKGEFKWTAIECANLIKKEHGEMCETYQTANKFLAERDELVEKYSDGINTDIVTEENEYDFDQNADELESEFLKDILEDYSIMLQNECEYLQSEESIIDTIKANEYEFTAAGNIF